MMTTGSMDRLASTLIPCLLLLAAGSIGRSDANSAIASFRMNVSDTADIFNFTGNDKCPKDDSISLADPGWGNTSKPQSQQRYSQSNYLIPLGTLSPPIRSFIYALVVVVVVVFLSAFPLFFLDVAAPAVVSSVHFEISHRRALENKLEFHSSRSDTLFFTGLIVVQRLAYWSIISACHTVVSLLNRPIRRIWSAD